MDPMDQLDDILHDHPKYIEIEKLIKEYGDERYDEGYSQGQEDERDDAK